MYIADSFGYLGSCLVMLYRNFGAQQLSWLEFFVGASYAMSVGCILLTMLSIVYFRHKLMETAVPATVAASQFAGQ